MRKRSWRTGAAVMAFCVAAAAHAQLPPSTQAQSAVVARTPLHDVYVSEHQSIGFARDEQFEYLATSEGLFRANRLAGGNLERMPAAGTMVHGVYAHEGTLYIMRGGEYSGSFHEPTLLRSRDRGVTFEAISEGLRDCSLAPQYPCTYLVAHDMSFAPGRIFLEAGGNVLVSSDDGATWRGLYPRASDGPPAGMICPVVFERIGTKILSAGECPLDIAFINAGILKDDLTGWALDPLEPGAPRVVTPPLQNRNFHFIHHTGGGTVFAGVEGGLLKSVDGGQSFRFVLHHQLSGTPRMYAYVEHILQSSRDPNLLIVAGFDKPNFHAWLAYSSDGGETWVDATPLVREFEHVNMLEKDADDRILIGTYAANRFHVSELVVGDRPVHARRRATRP